MASVIVEIQIGRRLVQTRRHRHQHDRRSQTRIDDRSIDS